MRTTHSFPISLDVCDIHSRSDDVIVRCAEFGDGVGDVFQGLFSLMMKNSVEREGAVFGVGDGYFSVCTGGVGEWVHT